MRQPAIARFLRARARTGTKIPAYVHIDVPFRSQDDQNALVKRAVLAFVLVACGGRLATTGGDSSTTDSAVAVDSGPLLDGGLVIGSCHLDVSFAPRTGAPYPVTKTDVQSTANRNGSTFELVCSGNAPNNYHYILRASPVGAIVGSYATMGELIEDPDTHNPQVGTGPCTIGVTSIATASTGEVVTGTIDCKYLLDDPIGGYTVTGAFAVPL